MLRIFMAEWLVREKQVSMVIVELRVEATWRLVRREIRQGHSAEPAVLRHLAADEQPARAILRQAVLPRERFAPPAWQSVRRARAFFAPTRQR